MSAPSGPVVRPATGEVTVDGVVIGQVRMVRVPGAERLLWGVSRMVLNRGRLAPERGVYASRNAAVSRLMALADQIREDGK